MKHLILSSALTLSTIPVQAAIIHLPYDLTSADDLTELSIGQTIHLQASITGLSPNNWLDTFIINMNIRASDTGLWSTPFNLVYSIDLNPALVLATSSAGVGTLLYAQSSVSPITSTTDFVLGFDITALALGSGSFTASGADIFSVDGIDYFLTSNDSLGFDISNVTTVPEPDSLLLCGSALLFGLFHLRSASARERSREFTARSLSVPG